MSEYEVVKNYTPNPIYEPRPSIGLPQYVLAIALACALAGAGVLLVWLVTGSAR